MKKILLSMELRGKGMSFQIFLCILFHRSHLKNLFLSFMKKLPLFVENVGWYLNLKADIRVLYYYWEK